MDWRSACSQKYEEVLRFCFIDYNCRCESECSRWNWKMLLVIRENTSSNFFCLFRKLNHKKQHVVRPMRQSIRQIINSLPVELKVAYWVQFYYSAMVKGKYLGFHQKVSIGQGCQLYDVKNRRCTSWIIINPQPNPTKCRTFPP